MTNTIYALAALGVFTISTLLFRRAAGTLSVRKLNIISFTYYNLLVFTCVGAFCVLMGFRDHYLIDKIEDESVIYKTCAIIAYVLIALPFAILLFNTIFVGGQRRRKLNDFYREAISYEQGERSIFRITVLLTALGTLATAYVFAKIGTLPLLYLLRGGEEADALRQEATRGFGGNAYIRNIVVLTFTPLLSYLSYIYMRVSKCYRRRWTLLFLYSFFLSVLIKTYNLEKAPVLYYIFYYYIIEVVLNNKKIFKLLVLLGGAAVVLVVFMYYGLFGYTGNLFTIRSGPGGRIFMTQVATLFLHVQAFPANYDFLHGASLPTIAARLVGASDSWVRSGRLVMELYNPAAVKAGTAGVMNALFVGEAYANWGLAGVAAAPFVVALPFSITYAVLLRLNKTPLSITFYIAMFITLTNSIQGGFVDYIYNATAIMTAAFFLVLSVIGHRGKIVLKGRSFLQKNTAEYGQDSI